MAQPEKIRRNVGALLGFAAIGVSIFGFAVGRPAGIFGWICQVGALVGPLGLVVSAAYVTLPRKLTPSMDAEKIVAWGDAGDTEAEAVKNLALGVEENYRTNAPVIDRMFRGQIAATICFGFAVIMLAAEMFRPCTWTPGRLTPRFGKTGRPGGGGVSSETPCRPARLG